MAINGDSVIGRICANKKRADSSHFNTASFFVNILFGKAMNTSEIKVLLKKEGAGTYIDSFGPSKFGSFAIWEVWTESDGEFEARFIVEESSPQPPRYFEEFQHLCIFLNTTYEIADLEERRHNRQYKMIVLYVAALVFMGTVAAFIYFISNGNSINSTALSLLAGIIASGGTMFFGAWKFQNCRAVKAEQDAAANL